MANAGQGISEGGFVAVLWALTALATLLVIGRVLIRSILVKSFHLDDLFSFLAYALLVIAMILATISNPLSYDVSAIIVGESPMPETSKYDEMVIRLRKWNVAGQMLFWTALYCVKSSFMFLYKFVLGSNRNFTRNWYAAIVYIVCCYGICLIGVFGQCGNARYLWTISGCSTSYVASLDQKVVWIDYVFNVTSDLVVVFLPMPVVWNLNMPTSQRLAGSAICSLATITIAFETVRTVKLYQNNYNLTNLYSYLELLVAVITAMLPSFRFLVSPAEKDREYRRLLWSRLTMRSTSSNSSGYSMHSHGHAARRGESSRQINVETTINQEPQEVVPPLPTHTWEATYDGRRAE